jgi:hypothetical protein
MENDEGGLTCHRCRRSLRPGEGKPLKLFFRLAAALSLGPVHAGMWLWEDLARDYCRRCRRWLSFLSVLLGVLVLTLAVIGFRWGRRTGII